MNLNCLVNNCWYHTFRPLIAILHILLGLPVEIKDTLFKLRQIREYLPFQGMMNLFAR